MNDVRRRAAICLALLVTLTACSIDTGNDDANDELYQISTIATLSAGGYDGLIEVDELLDHGDFGLGTFDHLDGEMMVLDGTVYRVPADGVPAEVDGSVTTPFAAVTTWDSEAGHSFSDPMSCADFQTAIDELLVSTNLPYAIKVEGQFTSLTTRSEERQDPPYEPLTDVLANQIVFNLSDVDATFVGFRLPDYMANSNSAGYHFHAVTDDLTAGGHVLDCQTGDVTVELDRIDSWQVDLSAGS